MFSIEDDFDDDDILHAALALDSQVPANPCNAGKRKSFKIGHSALNFAKRPRCGEPEIDVNCNIGEDKPQDIKEKTKKNHLQGMTDELNLDDDLLASALDNFDESPKIASDVIRYSNKTLIIQQQEVNNASKKSFNPIASLNVCAKLVTTETNMNKNKSENENPNRNTVANSTPCKSGKFSFKKKSPSVTTTIANTAHITPNKISSKSSETMITPQKPYTPAIDTFHVTSTPRSRNFTSTHAQNIQRVPENISELSQIKSSDQSAKSVPNFKTNDDESPVFSLSVSPISATLGSNDMGTPDASENKNPYARNESKTCSSEAENAMSSKSNALRPAKTNKLQSDSNNIATNRTINGVEINDRNCQLGGTLGKSSVESVKPVFKEPSLRTPFRQMPNTSAITSSSNPRQLNTKNLAPKEHELMEDIFKTPVIPKNPVETPSINRQQQQGPVHRAVSEWDTPSENKKSVQVKPGTVSTDPGSNPTRGKRKRKFPGPAGVLPKLKGRSLAELGSMRATDSPRATPQPQSGASSDLTCSQSGEDRFHEGPWQSMTRELEPGAKSILDEFNIASIVQRASKKELVRGKVPVICVMLEQVNTQSADASVLLRDPSGEMKGTIHRQLVKEYQAELQPGCVLVLRQCGVFSPSPKSHYLNITPRNVVRIYPKASPSSSPVIKVADFISEDFIIPEPPPPKPAITSPILGQGQREPTPFSLIGQQVESPVQRGRYTHLNNSRGSPSSFHGVQQRSSPNLIQSRHYGNQCATNKPSPTLQNRTFLRPANSPSPMNCKVRTFTPRATSNMNVTSTNIQNHKQFSTPVIAGEESNQTRTQTISNKDTTQDKPVTGPSSNTSEAQSNSNVLNFSIQDDMDDLLQGLDDELLSAM